MGSLSGQIAIVTGASRGTGKGVALELGAAGATVYVTGRTLRVTGRAISSHDLALEYGFRDVDGRLPAGPIHLPPASQ